MPAPIKTTAVESSNLKAIGYDQATQTLQVDFKSGKRYQYQSVPPDVFAEFQAAESVGKFFAARIKGEFFDVPLTEDDGDAAE